MNTTRNLPHLFNLPAEKKQNDTANLNVLVLPKSGEIGHAEVDAMQVAVCHVLNEIHHKSTKFSGAEYISSDRGLRNASGKGPVNMRFQTAVPQMLVDLLHGMFSLSPGFVFIGVTSGQDLITPTAQKWLPKEVSIGVDAFQAIFENHEKRFPGSTLTDMLRPR